FTVHEEVSRQRIIFKTFIGNEKIFLSVTDHGRTYRLCRDGSNSGKFYYGMTDEEKRKHAFIHIPPVFFQGPLKLSSTQIIRNLCGQSEQPQPNKIDLFSTMQSAGSGTC